MKKRWLWFAALILILPNRVDSTEAPLELSSAEQYQLRQQIYSSDFQYIPEHLSAYEDTVSYQDEDLKITAKKITKYQKLRVTNQLVNAAGQLLFHLSDGTYIPATTQLFFHDQISNHLTVNQTYWLKKGYTMWSSPIMSEAKKVSNPSLEPYQSLKITRMVETPVAHFVEIAGKGWISLEDLSEEDNRMEKVQQLLTTKYQKDTLAVYVKQLNSEKVASINHDKPFYAASVTKLPLLFYVQEKLNTGKIDVKQPLQYTPQSMAFKGAYQVGGSGSLSKTPDNQFYTVEELITKTAKESDNVASNLLAYYLADQFDTNFYQVMDLQLSSHWNMVSRETTVGIAGKIMELLYRQNGYVFESLFATQFDDQRISKDISVPVAHKIGDADDFRHDVAVIYADEPFVLAIFTKQSNYEEITQIANDVYGILK